MHEIEILKSQLQACKNSDEKIEAELNRKKESFEDLIKHEANGAFVRSRAQYKMDGEKPSKLFCSLEKHNGVQRYVPQLIVTQEDGRDVLINDQQEVETEICKFYKNLFSNKDNNLESQSIESFLGSGSNTIPKLSEDQKQKMEGKISLEEMSNYLKKCKNNVAHLGSHLTFINSFGGT